MRRRSLLALLVVLAPASARAQAPAGEVPPRQQEIKSVERGFFIESNLGFTWLLNSLNDRSYGPGIAAGVHAGYDITPIVSIMIGAMAVAASGPNDLTRPSGDLVFLVPMAHVQLAVITTPRNFLWIRAGGGFGIGLPAEVAGTELGGNGPAFTAAAHFEHFTNLRHFSIGGQAGVFGVTKPGFGIGLSIIPTLKYTF